MNYKELGAQIMARRLALGLALQQAAAKASVTQSHFAVIERGQVHDPAAVEHLVVALGGSIHDGTITWFPPPWDPPADPAIRSRGPVA